MKADFNSEVRLVEKPNGFYLEGRFDKAWRKERTRQLVTTKLLGKAKIPDLPYENADGTPLFELQLTPGLFASAALVALVVGVIAAASPARTAAQLDPAQAIRS